MITKFMMKAYKASSPSGYIYWTSYGVPDFQATNSGHPLSELSDISIRYSTQVPKTLPVEVIGPVSDGYM